MFVLFFIKVSLAMEKTRRLDDSHKMLKVGVLRLNSYTTLCNAKVYLQSERLGHKYVFSKAQL